jgi:cysteine-rich repeat protein
MPRRLLGLVLVASPACLSATGGPPADTTGSTGVESTGDAGASTGDVGSSSGGEASSSSEGGSESIGETSSTSGGPGGTTEDETTAGPQTSTGSTSGSQSYCGDGVVDPGEECDDANTEQEDSCSLICRRRRTVFITSEAFNPEFIGGLENADSLCRQYAQDLPSEHWKSFVAWMSDSKTSAIERIYYGYGVYARPDGVIVAKNVEQFVSGELLAPINVTEKGELSMGFMVWTGTGPDGWAVPGSQHCDDWTSKGLLDKGHVGNSGASNSDWTYISLPDVNPTSCGIKLRLYCFEGE